MGNIQQEIQVAEGQKPGDRKRDGSEREIIVRILSNQTFLGKRRIGKESVVESRRRGLSKLHLNYDILLMGHCKEKSNYPGYLKFALEKDFFTALFP